MNAAPEARGIVTNSFPGRCVCGSWVLTGQGRADAPPRFPRGQSFKITCERCMSPADKELMARRRARIAA